MTNVYRLVRQSRKCTSWCDQATVATSINTAHHHMIGTRISKFVLIPRVRRYSSPLSDHPQLFVPRFLSLPPINLPLSLNQNKARAQVLYAEGIEMALEQLRGGDPDMASSREELSVLRGIGEELGILGGQDAIRKFAGAFGVKQVQSGGAASSRSAPGKRGGGAKKKGAKGNNKSSKKGKGSGSGAGMSKKNPPTAGLLELRRTPGSPAVLAGRNNLQNDRITFTLARAHELWFHARGVAGAHVLLRLDPGQNPDDADVEFAADVAVYFSKGRQVCVCFMCKKPGLKRIIAIPQFHNHACFHSFSVYKSQ